MSKKVYISKDDALEIKVSEFENDAGYVTDTEIDNKFDNLGGTVEITSGEPEHDSTVLTINTEAEEVKVYTAEEVDAMLAEKQTEIDNLSNKVTELEAALANYTVSVTDDGNGNVTLSQGV